MTCNRGRLQFFKRGMSPGGVFLQLPSMIFPVFIYLNKYYLFTFLFPLVTVDLASPRALGLGLDHCMASVVGH